jgi:flagellar protein FliS
MQKSGGYGGAYKEAKVKTASQGRLIIMLYTEAVRQIDLAMEALTLNEGVKYYSEINASLNKAQDIVGELVASLDFEKGGEIAENLYGLYQFFNRELVESNLTKSEGNLVEVRRLMISLLEAWKTVDTNNPDPTRAVNIAG